MMTPRDNYLRIKQEINDICARCGRNPAEITLLCVSKGYSWEEAQSVYDAGCRDFGENRLEEAINKMALAPEHINWHFIGSLQSNKVGKVIGRFSLIHSVDSVRLAEKISQYSMASDVITPLLLQANTSGEPSKHGLSAEEWFQQFDKLLLLPNIKIEGLMTMAPFNGSVNVVRNCFKELRILKERLAEKAGTRVELKYLSMGMSNDYKIAIEEGATILRIGTAIFKN